MQKQPVLPPGTIIAGRYRIDKAIARGGCSIVYRGTHIEMQRPVALKLMSSLNGQIDRAWVERFKREARLASQLHHLNTITIFDYGASQGILFIAMEWVEGESLRNVIKSGGPISPERTARFARQILDSLAEAHQHHILHRDLKPSNIMITRDVKGVELLKVLDFGLAKAEAPGYNNPEALKLTADGDFVGTPRYASPEQLKGRPLSFASDIYGVGMVMWEMLLGSPAVPDVDFGTCVQHHLGSKPWKLPMHSGCPPSLARIVERALIKQQDARYQSCKDMRLELDHWLNNQHDPRSAFGQPLGAAPPVEERTQPRMAAFQPPTQHEADRTEEDFIVHNEMATAVEGPQRGPSFADVREGDLDIDRTARPAQRRAPIQHQRPVLPSSNADAGSDLVKKGIIGIVVIIIAVVGIWAVRNGLNQPEETGPTDEEVINKALGDVPSTTTTPKVEKVQPSEPSKDVFKVILILRRARWTVRGDFKPMVLDNWQQTTIRAKKDKIGADLIIYECKDTATAKSVLEKTKPSTTVVQLSDTIVIKIFPLLKNDKLTVEQLSNAIEALKKD